MLKKEYSKLNMDKLEAGVHEYMAEQCQGDKGQEEARLSGEQKKEMGDKALVAGQKVAPAPSELIGPSLSEIADPSSAEVIEPSVRDP